MALSSLPVLSNNAFWRYWQEEVKMFVCVYLCVYACLCVCASVCVCVCMLLVDAPAAIIITIYIFFKLHSTLVPMNIYIIKLLKFNTTDSSPTI